MTREASWGNASSLLVSANSLYRAFLVCSISRLLSTCSESFSDFSALIAICAGSFILYLSSRTSFRRASNSGRTSSPFIFISSYQRFRPIINSSCLSFAISGFPRPSADIWPPMCASSALRIATCTLLRILRWLSISVFASTCL